MYFNFSCSCDDFTDGRTDFSSVVQNEIDICFGRSIKLNNSDLYQCIDGRRYQINLIIDEGEDLFNAIRKRIRLMEDVIFSESNTSTIDILNVSNEIVSILSICRYSVLIQDSCTQKQLTANKLIKLINILQRSLYTFSKMPQSYIVKLVSTSSKTHGSALFTYFHTYLGIRWLILSSEIICGATIEDVKHTMKSILEDIVCLAYEKFPKSNYSVLEQTPFSCQCLKQLIVLVNLLCENLYDDCFWDIYNSCLESYEEEFSLWLLFNVAKMTFYDKNGICESLKNVKDNITHIETKVGKLLKNINDIQSSSFKRSLNLIDAMVNNLWMKTAKLDPYLMLWDYFYKHINEIAVPKPKTVSEFMQEINKIINNQELSNLNSYYIFLNILLQHLIANPLHWSKLRGRIYSRLSSNKLKTFNETGIYNVSFLFLVLSDIYFDELVQKLEELLDNFPQERKQTEQFLIINLSLVATHINKRKSIEASTIAHLQHFLNEAIENRGLYHLIKIYVEGLSYIINVSENLQFNQNLLFGKWMIKYMQSCQLNDLAILLSTFNTIIENSYGQGVWFEWVSMFLNYVLPGFKQIASAHVPQQLGKVAALILRNTPDAITQNLSYFTGSVVNSRVSYQFLVTFLEDYPENRILTQTQEHMLIQAWVRSLIFNGESNSQLSEKIMMFSVFSFVQEQLDIQEPFVSFIKILCKLSLNKMYMFRIREVCEICFGNLDRSISIYLSNVKTESVTLHIYTYVAYLFYHCSSLLYQKSKSNCLMSRLVTLLLLPSDVLVGKCPHSTILQAIEKTWHLFFQGIYKLVDLQDPFIERTLKQLVIHYLPHFTPLESPLIKCVDSGDSFSFIIDKLTKNFVGSSCKTSEDNTLKALQIILLSLKKLENPVVMKDIVKLILSPILEVLMFSLNKSPAIEILKYLALSEYYVNIREEIKQGILLTTEKHLAFSSNNYFQLVYTLVKLVPLDMKDLLPEIKKQIIIVEKMRGVGYDNTLRQHLQRIESTLNR